MAAGSRGGEPAASGKNQLMRLVCWIGTERPYEEVLETALLAERLGYDGIYLADHFMADTTPPAGSRLEAWTTLAALAARTERVRLGVLVSGNTYRHPAILAKMAATTDRISDGRLVLGLGAGWQLSEHVAYGIELPEVPELLGRLDEACQVIRSLLTKDRSDFDGRWYHLEDAPCDPKPVQARLPLLLGVSGEKIAMGIAAREADIWNYWGTPDQIGHKISVLEQHCETAGRDPSTIERSAQALIRMSTDAAELERWRSEPARMPTIVGTPEELSGELARYDELGVDEFVVSERVLGESTSERAEVLEQLINEVGAAVHD
ncbi:MAG: TIGR03560 family F420-dependent LLM class oxidoreductase, partial [Acidimicrobiales bacterium]